MSLKDGLPAKSLYLLVAFSFLKGFTIKYNPLLMSI